MSKLDDLSEEQIQVIKESAKFVQAVFEFANKPEIKRGIDYTFTCPMCGGLVHINLEKSSGHVFAKCDNCERTIMQ
jgi:Transcription elongation factor Elf1 like.